MSACVFFFFFFLFFSSSFLFQVCFGLPSKSNFINTALYLKRVKTKNETIFFFWQKKNTNLKKE